MHRIYLYCEPDVPRNTYEKNYSVFIVDDEPDTLESLRFILEVNSFKVEAFTDPTFGTRQVRCWIIRFIDPRYKNAKNEWL